MSIGGYAFTVEQDAATLLRDYIASLEKHYLPQADGKEIMDGIEERLAELLSERGHEVIDRSDVESATAVLGRPEAIDREIMRRSPSRRKSYDEIRELVVRCRSSGKTSEEWCREHGIVHSTYCNWRKKVIAREGKETLNQECGIALTRCDSRVKAQKEPDLIEIHLWG